MTCLAANNASARLATSVTVEDLAIQLATGEGAMFPTPSADDYFMITVFEQTGDAFNMEIMKCTHREGDVLTVERAQEGTSAAAFSVSGRVENRFTAGMYNAMGDEVRAIAQSVQQQLDGKQDTLTFDTTPTAGSSNPVTSDGIKNAIGNATSGVLGPNMQIFTASSSFLVPAGVVKVMVFLIGGGGGGGGSDYTNPSAGGASSFGTHMTATGGGAGSRSGSIAGAGGYPLGVAGSGIEGAPAPLFGYGAGGTGNGAHVGGGGGSGGVALGVVDVVPGSSIAVTVGAGGTADHKYPAKFGGSGLCAVIY